MYLYDLPKDAKIILEVFKDKQPIVQLDSVIEETSVGGNCALLAPIKFDEKILSFKGDDIKINATVIIDNKPVVWRNCSCQFIHYSNSSYHALISKSPGVAINRREAYRVKVAEYCYVNNGKTCVDAIITDISATGFAYIVGRYDDLDMNFVTLSYHDTLLDADIQLSGHVVRTVKIDETKTLYGCKMIPKDDVSSYINRRQRELLKQKKEV